MFTTEDTKLIKDYGFDVIVKEEIVVEMLKVAKRFDETYAIKFLQNCYNMLRGKKIIEVDGVIGKKTLKAINEHKNPSEIFVFMNILQENFPKESSQINSAYQFGDWLNTKVSDYIFKKFGDL